MVAERAEPVLGRQPQYTTRSHGCCECCQPYGFNNRLTAPTHRSVGCSMSLLRDWPRCRGCQCWAVRPQFIAMVCLFCSPHAGCRRDIHWTSTDSSQHCCLLSVYRMLGTARHDGVIWHRAARHPWQARLCHPSTYSYSHTPPTRGDSYIPKSLT